LGISQYLAEYYLRRHGIMRITFTARHFEASEQLREYVEKEVRKLQKFFNHIVDCEVILTNEKSTAIVEINLNVYNSQLTAKTKSEDFHKSVDMAVKKMERQLKRYKGKLRERFRRRPSAGKVWERAGEPSSEEEMEDFQEEI